MSADVLDDEVVVVIRQSFDGLVKSLDWGSSHSIDPDGKQVDVPEERKGSRQKVNYQSQEEEKVSNLILAYASIYLPEQNSKYI